MFGCVGFITQTTIFCFSGKHIFERLEECKLHINLAHLIPICSTFTPIGDRELYVLVFECLGV